MLEPSLSQKKKKKRRQRRLTGWNCFVRERTKGTYGPRGRHLTEFDIAQKRLGEEWRSMSSVQKEKFQLMARQANARRRAEKPAFSDANPHENDLSSSTTVKQVLKMVFDSDSSRSPFHTQGPLVDLPAAKKTVHCASRAFCKCRREDEEALQSASAEHQHSKTDQVHVRDCI